MADFFRHHHFHVLGAVHDFFARRADILSAHVEETGARDVFGGKCVDRWGRRAGDAALRTRSETNTKERNKQCGQHGNPCPHFHDSSPLCATLARKFYLEFRSVGVYNTDASAALSPMGRG